MTWSTQLAEAAEASDPNEKDPQEGGTPGRGEKTPLGIGQHIEVRTKSGELVATGDIVDLAPETKTVSIIDRESGADLNMEIDPSVYDIWVKEYDAPGDAPNPSEKPKLNVNPRKPGVHSGGRF